MAGDWKTITNEREKYQAYLCSREWCERRDAVRERAGGVCERCEINPIDAVHHLTYERKYAERLADLQAICEPCHKFTHGKSDVDPSVNGRLIEAQRDLMALCLWRRDSIVSLKMRDECFQDYGEENHGTTLSLMLKLEWECPAELVSRIGVHYRVDWKDESTKETAGEMLLFFDDLVEKRITDRMAAEKISEAAIAIRILIGAMVVFETFIQHSKPAQKQYDW